ncbi:MAG: dienelactone hydrolase family protein [Deltaproteobacteria bacterium]|nr:dienelactone hydrolase family protein [Deltaproteobacteria bacterium]
MEPSAHFEEFDIPLAEPIHGCEAIRGVLGIPEWWPTGERVAVVIAHGSTSDFRDPLIATLATALAEQGYLTLRFNFAFAETGKRSSANSPAQLERCFRAALNALGRDPTALPARLVIGGMGLGGRVAAGLVADQLRADGLFLLGFPLHPQGKPDQCDAETLYRVTSPMLFVQGTRDRRCDRQALRSALRRVGAPLELHDVKDADASFHLPKKSGRSNEELQAQVCGVVSNWIARRLA